MTIVQRIDQLRTAAVAVGDDYQLKLRTGELRSLHDRLRAVADDLPGLVTAVRELRAGGASLDDDIILEAASLATTIGELRSTLSTLRYDSPMDGPKRDVRDVEAFLTRFRESVKAAWAAQVESDTALVDDELVEALHRGGAEVEELRRALTGAGSALLVLRNRSLPAQGDMAKLTAAFAARRDCADRVRDLVPGAVAEVILGARGATGVPLSLMTAEVLGELDRLGIRERFMVTLR
jgi:hypothetical protein